MVEQFGTIHNLNINYAEELKAIIPEPNVREEIEKYFEEIKAVTAEENINKSKLASIFKKIREKAIEKGLDKVTDKLLDVGWVYAMTQIMQLIKQQKRAVLKFNLVAQQQNFSLAFSIVINHKERKVIVLVIIPITIVEGHRQ